VQTAINVRAAEAADFRQWAGLYRRYRAFYRLEADEEVVERVWQWVADPANEMNSFVAVSTTEPGGPELVGLANYRRFSRPSSGTIGVYLDDLFAAETARGRGVGRALLRRLSQLAQAEGLSVVRWMTSADNQPARRLYDDTATLTKWVTYELLPGSL
jgi:RimJ/RimL family protein N-acetyltransferase